MADRLSELAGRPATARRPDIAGDLVSLAVPVDDLELLPGNPRRGDVAAIARSLKKFGQRKPIVVRRSDAMVVAGNHTLQAAKQLGWTEIAVVWVDDDDPTAQAYALADNRTAELGGYDDEALAAMVASVQSVDPELLAATGWTDQDLASLLEKMQAPAEHEQTAAEGDFAVFPMEEVAEAAFNHFRQAGFPYRHLARYECMQQINRLAVTADDDLLGTDTGYHVADTYHPHRFRVRCGTMKTPTEAFEDDKLLRKVFRLGVENGRSISDTTVAAYITIVSGTQAASNFRPGFALHMYRRFCPSGGTVLDASTGFGGRLVGFLASAGGLYIGIDPASETHRGNQRLVDELGMSRRVVLLNLPAEDVPHEAVAGRCDFAFTSPPYFAKERYSDEPTQSWKRYVDGEAWRVGFLEPMMALQYVALKPGSQAAVNIADVEVGGRSYPLEEWTIEAGKAAGFHFVKREKFPISRAMGSAREAREAFEPVLIFQR